MFRVIFYILFVLVFLLILGIIFFAGGLAGTVFTYFRVAASYIKTIKDEVTNPFAKIFTIAAICIGAIGPAVLFILLLVGSMFSGN